MWALMHRVYRKQSMKGYFKYLQKKHKGGGMVTKTVSYTISSDTCLQGKVGNIQKLYSGFLDHVTIWEAKEEEGARR